MCNLIIEVTCYVIDRHIIQLAAWTTVDTLKLDIPSTVHQCLKYVDRQWVVKTVYVEKQPFNELKNYFTNSIHYKKKHYGNIKNDNEVDSRPNDTPEDVSFHLEPLVVNVK